MTVANRKTSYEIWLDEEDIPVVGGYGVTDVRELALKPWKRTGGRGAYIDLKGMEGFTGMYVGEIAPGAALNPEHHLYEELIYIIQGIGATELWSAGDEKRKMHFEWQQGSLFAIPLNTRHRMINGSRDPVAKIIIGRKKAGNLHQGIIPVKLGLDFTHSSPSCQAPVSKNQVFVRIFYRLGGIVTHWL